MSFGAFRVAFPASPAGFRAAADVVGKQFLEAMLFVSQ